jgi:hypothetical protein
MLQKAIKFLRVWLGTGVPGEIPHFGGVRGKLPKTTSKSNGQIVPQTY